LRQNLLDTFKINIPVQILIYQTMKQGKWTSTHLKTTSKLRNKMRT